MSISPGFTAAEIREFVHEYEMQPHGQKYAWLAAQNVGINQMRRWRMVVFGGDLDRGLIPREGESMTIPPRQRAAWERARAAERAAHESELARMQRRVRELEETNDALGKAIGLLHARSGQEPVASPTPTDPSSSSPPSTSSSPS